jgi:hypothetical protein
MAVAEALLSAGASTRRDDAGETALHAAAARGPLQLVEHLIRAGAIDWQRDRKRRTPLQLPRPGHRQSRHRRIARPPGDPRSVVPCRRGGDPSRDAAGLARLLDTEPRLLHERIMEPDCYRDAGRPQYFLDPRLFWFIANNPTLIRTMPANVNDVAEAMISRGVEQSDLDYALELVMTSSSAREQGLQAGLIGVLLKAGATPRRRRS